METSRVGDRRCVKVFTESFGPGDGGIGLPGVPAFGFAGVSPRAIGAQGRERGIVGAAGEVDFHAAQSFVQAPGGSNCGNCVTATVVTAVAEGGFDGGIAVM
jgi:hypothetical protein